MRSRTSLSTLTALAILVTLPARVQAGGYELLPGGTQSVARGGAVAARPENAMLLAQDPAGLSLLSGNQMLLNYDVPLHEMCVDPYGYYGWGIYQPGGSEVDGGNPLAVKLGSNGKPVIGATYATTPLPEVCNSGRVVGLPQMVWAGKLTDDLAIAGGFVAPTVVAGMQFGGADGTIDTPDGARPTPTRYQMIRQQVKFALAPSAGVAYRIMPQLQVGMAMQVAMVRAVSRAVENSTSGTQPRSDWLVDLDAHDYFIPSLTFSVHSKPIPALDLVAAFRWTDKFDGTGKVTIETGTYGQGATSGPVPYRNAAVDLSRVAVGLPWALTLGARYAGRLPDSTTDAAGSKRSGLGDPMDRDLWDAELDFNYEINTPAAKNIVDVTQDVTLITRQAGGGGDLVTVKAADLASASVNRHLQNAVALRAGGSYSIMPRKVALQAGAFFETRGQDPAYAGIDSFAFQRIGFGLGAMMRLGDFDLLAAYGHIFQETVEVAPPPHQLAERGSTTDPTAGFDQQVGGIIGADGTRRNGIVLSDPSAPSPAHADAVASAQQNVAVPNRLRSARVINAGKYTGAFNVISLGAVYHF
jgi:hypothetical protein